MATDKLQKIIGPRAPEEELAARRLHYLWPTLCFVTAAILLVISIFLPYWSMVLHAPQYPKGLVIHAYLNRLDGDVREINSLNHYIGMRPLEEAAHFEKSVAIFGVVALALVVIAAVYIHSPWSAVLTFPAIVFPGVFLLDLFYWMYNFGRNLDPHAALSNAIKPFTPTVLGEGTIGQFRTVGYADFGLLLAIAASLLILAGLYLQRRAYKPLMEAQPSSSVE
ncbi:MAG: cytochrome C [Caldilineae bacterium]|nr:MAG: cytochrome C [Caldilineae bacterium]